MFSQVKSGYGTNEQVLQGEIARLNKIIQALMNRAERSANLQGSDFNLFQTAITLEDQVRRRTGELEAALLENEKITRDLRESEHHNRVLIENSPMCIHEIDMEGRIVSMNRAGLLMLGLKDESEVQGSPCLDMVDAADQDLITALLAKAYAGESSHFEYKSSKPDGQIYKTCVVPIKNKIGTVEKLMGITEDITERKRMEETLRESEERYRLLVELSPDAILIRADGKLVFTNNAGAKLLGVGRTEDIYSRESLDDVHPDYREFVRQRMANALRTGMPSVPAEVMLVGLDGSHVQVEVSSVPVRYKGEIALLTIARDITERKKVQDNILKTQKLESLGILAGGIAHDFNNILTAILGNISLARIQVHDREKVAQRLEEAENAAVRAKDLTQQLLTFARGGEPVKKIIMLNGLLKEAAGFAVHGSAVTSEFVLANDLWPVEADEGQLSQVIHNLVINAVQAMPDGGTITIAAHNADSLPGGKRQVEISVADTGTGIPHDLLTNIFDPYFTTKDQGSGLGLASCYSIIKKHDGDITVESIPGTGTTFYISLPAAEQLIATESAPCLEVTLGKGRILVMDDEEMVREIAKASLEELGYLVECTDNGGAAVELYRRRKDEGAPFVAAIMDLTIPGGIGGKEAITELIQIDPHVKAVVSSGYATDPVMANYRNYGFSAVLVKPYRLQEMSAVLNELLETGR